MMASRPPRVPATSSGRYGQVNDISVSLLELAKRINEDHDRCILAAADAVTYAIKAGQKLLEVQDGLERGEFDDWLEEHCRFSRATAFRYMKVAQAKSLTRETDETNKPKSIREALRIIAEESEDTDDQPPWQPSEKQRRKQVERGESVTANIREDTRLIEWAQRKGLYVKIDRQTDWGNPFILDEDGDRNHVCDAYGRYLEDKLSLRPRFGDLRGKVLGCWCYPERCHGDVLIEQLEGASDEARRVGCHR